MRVSVHYCGQYKIQTKRDSFNCFPKWLNVLSFLFLSLLYTVDVFFLSDVSIYLTSIFMLRPQYFPIPRKKKHWFPYISSCLLFVFNSSEIKYLRLNSRCSFLFACLEFEWMLSLSLETTLIKILIDVGKHPLENTFPDTCDPRCLCGHYAHIWSQPTLMVPRLVSHIRLCEMQTSLLYAGLWTVSSPLAKPIFSLQCILYSLSPLNKICFYFKI